jgi:hypothetical protein
VVAIQRSRTLAGLPLRASKVAFLTHPSEFFPFSGYHHLAPQRVHLPLTQGDHGGRSQEKEVEVKDTYASRL